jgi:hypothetical protein
MFALTTDKGCNIMFRLECPEVDPSKCAYDSDGKKKCMRYHPFSALAMSTATPDMQFGPHHNDKFGGLGLDRISEG